MNDLLQPLPLRHRYEIGNAIRSGDKLCAIRLYREATGCDLATAYRDIELVSQQMQAANPYAFRQRIERQDNASGCLVFVIIAATFIVLFGIFPPDLNFQKIRQYWQKTAAEINATLPWSQKTPPVPQTSVPNEPQQMRPRPIQAPSASLPNEQEKPYRAVIPEHKELNIAKLYRQKLANPNYVRWTNLPGLPQGYQDYPEEHAIKYARSRIAEKLRAPPGTSIAAIPYRPDRKIVIDGIIDDLEWQDARRLPLLPQTTGSVLYLQADAEWLYIACDVPGETTESGFDQLRFYFHVDIDPTIKNERIHLGRHDKRLGGIRETTVIQGGHALSDWQIYRMARGATTLHQHRQYEAKIHLGESGLHRGVPFPVFVEIETDPLLENGKFKRRVHLGELGSQQRPIWLLIL